MSAACPEVAESGYWIVGERWRDGGFVVTLGGKQQVVDFFRVEAPQAEIEICRIGVAAVPT
jgi:hypothetical protein